MSDETTELPSHEDAIKELEADIWRSCEHLTTNGEILVNVPWEKLREWFAIAATLGSGTLTAEQVRETVEKHGVNDGCVYSIFKGSFKVIADELNAAWNSRAKPPCDGGYCHSAERTCKSTTDDNAWCFVCSECGKSFPRNKLHLAHNHGEINYCPNCGAKVREVVGA